MIGFRVDANEFVATGHLVRCITVAKECIKMGKECIFILAENKDTDKLDKEKIPYIVINTEWNKLIDEIEILGKIILENKLEWLIVDSYQATKEYLFSLEKIVKVLYFDDMCLEKYNVSALLHYSQWNDDNRYNEIYKDEKVFLLSGMQYTPLREEFSIRSNCIRRKEILITTGGMDSFNITGRLINAISKSKILCDYDLQIIVGSMNNNEKELRLYEHTNSNVHLHKNISNIGEFMQRCEVAVSAGGTTLYELCACGTPTVCFSFADNQKDFVNDMGNRKIMLCVGDARDNERIEYEIIQSIEYLVSNERERDDFSKRMKKLVDGRGALRIAEFLSR